MKPPAWLLLLVILFGLGILLHTPMLVIFSTAMIVVLGVAYEWQKHSLDGVIYRRRFHFTRAFPGEEVPLRLEVENRKLLPLAWLRVQDPWPKAIAPKNGTPESTSALAPSHIPDQWMLTHIFSLRWYERVRRSYPLVFQKRGIYRVGPALLTSGDFFGIYEHSREIFPAERITVFPPLLPAQALDLPAEDPFGDRKSRRRLFEDPNRPVGIREYHPEDEFRRVHWPATARTGQLQVKIYQPTSAQALILCLNVSTFAHHWEGIYPALLEFLVSLTATLAAEGVEAGYRVGLISNGCLSNSDQTFRIPPGRSPNQLAHLLVALAGATAITVAPFERFLLHAVPSIPYGATLVIITAVTTPELSETLIQIRRHERRILLISLAQEPPPAIPGVKCIHRPFRE